MAVIYEGKSFMDHAATFPCEEMGGPSRPRPPGPTARLNKIHFDLIIFQ